MAIRAAVERNDVPCARGSPPIRLLSLSIPSKEHHGRNCSGRSASRVRAQFPCTTFCLELSPAIATPSPPHRRSGCDQLRSFQSMVLPDELRIKCRDRPVRYPEWNGGRSGRVGSDVVSTIVLLLLVRVDS